jgi:hypothetical protein
MNSDEDDSFPVPEGQVNNGPEGLMIETDLRVWDFRHIPLTFMINVSDINPSREAIAASFTSHAYVFSASTEPVFTACERENENQRMERMTTRNAKTAYIVMNLFFMISQYIPQ